MYIHIFPNNYSTDLPSIVLGQDHSAEIRKIDYTEIINK